MEKCVNDKGICLYKNKQGLKCAAGCLIPDAMYDPDLEDKRWHSLVLQKFAPTDHMELIQKMQYIHDEQPVSNWEHALNILERRLDAFK